MLVGSAVRRVAIIGGVRIPFARAHSVYARAGNEDMLTAVFRAAVERFRLNGVRLGDVAAGAVIKHTKDYNLTRECVLSSGLDPQTPGVDLQRACGTSLEAAILIGNKIALGQIECGLAGGTDSISDAPIVYPRSYQQLLLESYRGRSAWQRMAPLLRLRPRHFKPVLPAVVEPRTGLSMGQSTELMAKRWKITREDQDRLAFDSHMHAAAAWRDGFYDDLVVEFAGLKTDNNVRADTSLDKLAKLRPTFDPKAGTMTAGNSTPLTDGASAVLLGTEDWARQRNLPVLAYLTHGKVWAVDFASGQEGLLMAPAHAVPAMLRDANLTLQDFDYYEIHEAFAAQVLCTLKAWESPEYCRDVLGLSAPLGSIDRSRLNVKGGSIALGHPFAATGTRIVASLAKLLAADSTARRGLISACTAGGMGVTAILQTAP
ncbi:MAG TPA: acetyl-CoA C-acetyltransferase [Steroidobacteraceae bacterium]|nr:acetyl-CoA C-acetyltransferase [Steroidobacteraceae bacterium]